MNEDAVFAPENTENTENAENESGTFFVKRLVFFVLGALFLLVGTISSAFVLRPVPYPVELDSLESPEEVKEGVVYRISDLKLSGIFMYEGDAKEKGTPRESGEGIFLEKEHVHAYHTLALIEKEKDNKVYVFTFSVDEKQEDMFNRVAEHDAKENKNGDTGNSFATSAYVKVKALESDSAAAFEQSRQKTLGIVGAEKLNWNFYELEYCCDGDENYHAQATAEKREWLRITLIPIPFAVVCIVVSFIKPKKRPCNCSQEQETQSTPE